MNQGKLEVVKQEMARVNIDILGISELGFSVHHQLPELAQTHQVGDVIQPSHSLSSPSPPAFSLYQYQGLFQ